MATDIRLLILSILCRVSTGTGIYGESSSHSANGTLCTSNEQCPNLQTCCGGTDLCCPAEYSCCIGINWCCPDGFECTMADSKCIELTGLKIGPLIGGLIGLVALLILIIIIIRCCPDHQPEWKKNDKKKAPEFFNSPTYPVIIGDETSETSTKL